MSNNNKSAKESLKAIYGNRCLLTNLRSKRNLTYHHCIKKTDGGKATVENGANLIGQIHNWLHCSIEFHDEELFNLINTCLMLYKMCLDQHKTELVLWYEQEIMPLFYEKYEEYTREHRPKKRRK